ncbi:hypothetical protein PVK06_005551 [Gossypium arboreum]|uniref:Uncharacterized protein n=1 Tax=Gossypium arboreum TaxID=29729 RepID=A0ABR0QUW7_GOSAR|nr:hypothetical protein PVK06_005551 [Gossypium arboreum]
MVYLPFITVKKPLDNDITMDHDSNPILGFGYDITNGGSYKSMGDETIWSERVMDGVTLSVSRSMADQYITHHCCWNRILLDDAEVVSQLGSIWGMKQGKPCVSQVLCNFSRL